MPQTANEKLADLAIRNQVNVLRYTEGQLRAIRRLLREAEIDLTRRLFAAGTDFSRARLGKMLSAVNSQIQELEKALFGHSQAQLGDFARQQAGVALVDIQSTLKGLGISLTTPNFDLIAKAATSRPIHGKLLKDWWKEWGAATRAAVQQQVRLGLVENESIDAIVRRIRGTRANRFTDGVLRVKTRHAEALVRTAVNSVATQAKNDVYEANEDVVEAVEWAATLDGKTTPICQARDGKMAAIGGRDQATIPASSRLKPPSARPPAHVNCRSTILPVITDWAALGLKDPPESTRASLGGPVSNKLDYEGWLRQQLDKPGGLKFVEGVLGKAKTQLFIKGKLSLTRFVDKAGRAYSLNDLKRLNPKAWKVAFAGKGGLNKPAPKPKPKIKKPKPAKPKTSKGLKGITEVFDGSTSDGVTMARLQEILAEIPGAAAQVRLFNGFLKKHKTGSVFALESHTMSSGYHHIRAGVREYIKTLPPAHRAGFSLEAVVKHVAHNSPAGGYTADAFNFVVIRLRKDAGKLAQASGKELAEGVKDALRRWKDNTRSNVFTFGSKIQLETRHVQNWLHEMGHQIHFRAGSPSIPAHLPRVSRYSATDSKEWFAEHFSAWVMNRAALLKEMPEVVKYIDDLVASVL